MPGVGIPLPEVSHDLPELSRNDVAAPQLVMLANVVISSETSSSDCNAEEKQMFELKTVGSSNYSDSDEEGVIRYSLDNEMSEGSYAEQDTRVEPEVTERSPDRGEMEIVADLSEKTSPESQTAEKRKRNPVVVFESTKKKKPFFCKPCQYQAENEEDFIHHIGIHSAKKMIAVNRAADSDDDLASESGQPQTPNTENGESLSNSKGVIRCERCGYNTNRYDHYMAHLKHHTKEGEDQRVFKCTICAYTTISQYHWKKHLRNHFPSKLFTCNQCSYFSDRKNNYIQHIRTHTGERPFQCIYCEYSSSQKTHLTRHMRTHSGERPFKCDSCSYLAANQHEVTRHARQVHNGPKPLSCPYCQYKTADRSNFKKHVELHVNPRQFLCPVCKYAASKKCNLQYHIKSRHPGYSDTSLDVSKVRLRVKRTDGDDLPMNTGSKLADEIEERGTDGKEVEELDDIESGPINLSIKKPSKPTSAPENELTDRTSKKNADFSGKEKSGKPIQQPNEKTGEKKSPKGDGKEKSVKKDKRKTSGKVADVTTTQPEVCVNKQDSEKQKEIKKVEKSSKSLTKVAKGRPKKEKPLKEAVNEATAKHQTTEEQRLDLDKERVEKELQDKNQKEKEERKRLEKENSSLNETVKEIESAKNCRKSQSKKTYKKQTKLAKVNTEKETKSTQVIQDVRTKPAKRKAETMNVPEAEVSEQNCHSKRVKRKKKDANKPLPTPSTPVTNHTIPEILKAMKSKSKNDIQSTDKTEIAVMEPKNKKRNEEPSTPQTGTSTTEPLKVLDEPDQVHKTNSAEHEPTHQTPEPESPIETDGKTSAVPNDISEVDSGIEIPSPTDSETSPVFSPTLELPGPPGHKSTYAEDDEGIHSNDGGSDISDSASEGSYDSGLNGLAAATEGVEKLPETPTEELPSPSKLLSHTCIFCDRTFSMEVDYRRHLNRHLVNVYYLEGAAQGDK